MTSDGDPFKDTGVPVLGLTDILDAVRHTHADTVAVTCSSAVDGVAPRALAWNLQGNGVDLLVAPALTDVAGTRIHVRPVSGLPLLHVEEPQLSGGRRLTKGLLDRTCAGVALLVLLPFLLLAAVLVNATNDGPALYRQARVGRHAKEFMIYKFRSMYGDAAARLADLESQNQHGPDGVLFKIKKDPRITGLAVGCVDFPSTNSRSSSTLSRGR